MPWAPIAYPAATKILKAALDNGANFWNGVCFFLSQSILISDIIDLFPTAQGTFYGTPTNNSLHLLNHYFTTHPSDADKVVLSIKGSYDHTLGPQGSPSALRAAVDAAIAILPPHIKKIDVFEMARVDPDTDVEISITALAELVEEGKIGGIGLSEVSARTIRRASAVCEISAMEVEMSLFSREILENGVREVCEECKSMSTLFVLFFPPFVPAPFLFARLGVGD